MLTVFRFLFARTGMKPYYQYMAPDLAADDLFIRWVQHPDDEEIAAYWHRVAQQNPALTPTLAEAKALVLAISQAIDPPGLRPDEVAKLWKRIRGEDAPRPTHPVSPPPWRVRYVALALGALLLLGAGGWQLYGTCLTTSDLQVNATTHARKISLPDGSTVTLLPHSSLRYTPRFFGQTALSTTPNRAVWLTGCANFVVAAPNTPGPETPFLVHTTNLTAEGTNPRFQVRCQRGTTRIWLEKGELCLRHGNRQMQQLSVGESVLVAGNYARLP